ncbi:hypothetical protein [Streptomyces decoyicus]|uniref:hypothetical protein n=1 Tax=Streptomyces decoyicus TaxID=249567 RepID=UPI00380C8494
MSTVELTAAEVARCVLRAGLPPAGEHHADVAATANHIHAVLGTLRDLDYGETPPATHAAHVVERGVTDASL